MNRTTKPVILATSSKEN